MKHINPMKYINTMKHIFTISYRKALVCALTVLLSAVGAVTMQARSFEQGERIYINGTPSSLDSWETKWKNNCELWCKLINGGSSYWIKVSGWYTETVYFIEIPEGAVGDWSYIRLARYNGGANPGYNEGDKQLNITGEIWIDSEKNYIENFGYGDGWRDAYWRIIARSPSGKPTGMDGSSWTMDYEDEQICTSATGSNYTLAPKNYDYDNSKCHAWFTYNNSTGNWDRLPGENNWEFRSNEGYQDETITLGVAYSDTYYFYQANKPSQCRLLRVRLNQDCSDGYSGACKITSFAAVASDANVTDKISSVDGLVAFDDKKNAGDLMIWCEGVDTVIIPNDEIVIPQTFKLKGFDASTETTYTLHTKFLGDASGTCINTCNVTVAPPETTIKKHTTNENNPGDKSLTRFTEDTITLFPDNQTSTGFMWINSENEDRISDEPRNRTFTSDTEKEITYTFIATHDPVIVEPNLISVGGSFESNSGFSSNYDFWGLDPENYYDSHSNASGGYAICSNSSKFSSRYNEVEAHEGSYFGLFDSKIYDGTDQDAWRVEGLSVQSGTSYLFSFWVANINNFGEMNNGAQLQFQISYDDGANYADLGDEIDLSDYRDNRWHGISSIVTPPATVNNAVRIRVINKNQSTINRGNDFGLDGIRFEAITTRSSNVEGYEVFPVKYLLCEIFDATFDQRQAGSCGATTANVDFTINYKNPRGDLYIYEGTTKLAQIANSAFTDPNTYSGYLADRPLDGNVHEYTVYFKDALVQTDAPTTYKDTAHTTPAISVVSTEWIAPSCGMTTCILRAVLSYTNQNGTLSANVDGGTAITPSYIVENDTAKTITLEIPGVIADGKTGHKLNVSFSGSHGCSIANYNITVAAPMGNTITAFSVEAIEPACDITTYQLRAKWSVSKASVEGSVYDRLIIADKNEETFTTLKTIAITAANATDGTIVLDETYAVATAAHPTIVAYLEERGKTCYTTAADYVHPTVPAMTIGTLTFEAIECNKSTFNLVVPVTYKNQHGDMYVRIDDKTPEKVTDAMCKTGDGLSKYTKDSKSELLTKVVVSGLELTGSHSVTIKCDGTGSCQRTQSFTAPMLPKAELVTPITMPTIAACDKQTFDLTVSIKFTNQDGDLQVKVDEGSWKTFYTPSESTGDGKYVKNSAEQVKSVTLTGLPADGGTTHKIYYRFNIDGYCGYATPLESDALTFPQSPTVISTSVSTTPTAVACDATTYTRTVTVNYKNGKGKKIVIEDEAGNKLYTSPTALEASEGSITPTVTLTAIDGADGHYVIAYFEGYDCKSTDPHKGTYKAPVKPIISEVKVTTVGDTKCSPYKYSVSGTVTYSNADVSKKLIVAYGTLKDEITISSASATVDFSISDMTATGSTLTVEAYFKDAPDACTKTSNTFASPTQPSMEIKSIKQSTPGCNDQKYNLTFDVDYIYQHGNLTVSVDSYGDTIITIPETSRRQKEKQTVHVTYTGKIPADGATHPLTATFAGANSCSDTKTLSAVLSPVITDLKVNVPTEPIDCEATSYTASVTVETQYAIGKHINIVYKNKSDVDVKYGPYEITESPQTFSGLSFADVGAITPRSVRVYLSERDTCEKTKGYSIPPTTSIAPFTVGIDDHSFCENVVYDIEGDITYTSKPADANPAVRFGTYSAEMSNITATSAHYYFTGVATEGKDLTVEAYFTNKPKCFVSSEKFNSPLMPDIKVTKQTMSDPLCPAITTTLTFDVEYTKQPAGTMTVWVDNHTGEHTVTYTANAGSETPTQLKNLTVSGIPADGKTHTLYVSFSNGCEESFETPLAKFNASITEEDVTITDEFCNSDTYTATVTFKVANCQDKDVTVKGKGQTITQRATNGTNTVTFTGAKAITRTIDNTEDDKFEIYFADALSSCSHVVASYIEKPKPALVKIELDAAPDATTLCNATEYTLTGRLGYRNIKATPRVWLDDVSSDDKKTALDGYKSGFSTDEYIEFQLTVPADGKTHTVHADVTGWECAITPVDHDALWRPAVKDVKWNAPEFVHCDEPYDVKLEIEYERGVTGKNIYAWCTDHSAKIESSAALANGTGKATITLSNLTDRDNGWHNLTIYFEGMEASCPITSYKYNAPETKTLTLGAPTANTVECGDPAFSITGSVTSNVTSGVVIVTDGAHSDEFDLASRTTYTISGLTTGGSLTAQFKDHNCSKTDAKTFSAVALKPIPTFSLKDITPQCYPAKEFAIGYEHTNAQTIVYTVNSGDEQSVDVNSSNEFTINTTGWADGEYTITASAVSADDCPSASSSSKKLIIRKQPKISIEQLDDACDDAFSTALKVKTTAATSYNYYIVGETQLLATPVTVTSDGEHTTSLSISTLNVGDVAKSYTLKVVANSENCVSDTIEESFIIYPLPKLAFDAIEPACHPASSVEVTYTQTNTKSFTYTVKTKDGLVTMISDETVTVDATQKFTITTDTWAAGEYTLTAVAKSNNGCTTNTDPINFTILPKPAIEAIGVGSLCKGGTAAYLTLNAKNATHYRYYIVGKTALSDKIAIGASTVDLPSDLEPGQYKFKLVALSETCHSDTAECDFNIWPLPTFNFKPGEVRDCHPSTGINVGYTSTNAKTYSYTLTLGGESSSALAEDNQPAVADGEIPLNTTGLAAGTYDLVVTATSKDGCDMLASVSRKVIIQAKPTVSIESVESHCAGNASINVSYKTTDATTYYYEVLGTELKGHADAVGEGSFTIDISSLEPGNYTLRMKATAGQCESDPKDKGFDIYPIPTVSFDTPAPIRSDVTSVDVTIHLSDAATNYDYDFNYLPKTHQYDENVSASKTKITIITEGLGEGTYKLYVTPKNLTTGCVGKKDSVNIVINNKPSINFTEPAAVCFGTPIINIAYGKSADAEKLTYTISKKGDTTPKVSSELTLASNPSPLAFDINGWEYGTYTLKGKVSYEALDHTIVEGDESSVDFIILAPLTASATQNELFIGCNESYTATVVVNLYNAAGRTIHAKYSDDGDEYTPQKTTNVGDETVTFTLSGLKNTGENATNTVDIFVEGYATCGTTATFNLPQTMTINPVSAVCKDKSCNADKDTVVGTVWTNCNVGVVRVEYIGDATIYDDIDLTTADRTYQLIIPSGNTPKVQAYFLGESCEPFVQPYTPKPMPEANITAEMPPTLLCDVTTFDLPFTLNYKYQGEGTLTVWVEDFPEKAKTFTSAGGGYTALDPGSLTLKGKIEGLPADGRTGKKLYYTFDGTNSCADEITLADFPNTPVIDSVKVVKDKEYIEGLTAPYYPTVTVYYKRAKGQTIMLEYFDKENNSKYAESPEIDSDEEGSYIFDKTTVADWSFDDATMGERVVHAYFKGSQFNNCHEGGAHDGHYTAPTNCSIKFESIDAPTNKSTCDNLLYDLTGKVSFVGAALGDLIVEMTIDGTTYRDTIDHSLCVPEPEKLPFVIENINKPIPDGGKQLTAYFSELKSNTSDSEDKKAYSPAIPTINVVNPEYAKPECGETTTSLTFELEYTLQNGELHLYVGEDEQNYTIDPATPLVKGEDTKQTAIITIADLPADLSVRTLRVQFDDDHSCDKPFPLPAAPFSPKVTDLKAEITDVACDKDTYTLNVSFTVENSQNKPATLRLRGTGEPVDVNTTDGTHYSHSFYNVERTYGDATDDFVEVSFAASDADCSLTPMLIKYTEMPKPAISLTLDADQGETSCDETYPLQGEIRYTYLDQTPEIWIDAEAHKPVTVQTKQSDEQVIDLADLAINVPADGREHHVYIQPNGWTNNCPIDVPFNALQQPIITAAEVSGVPAFISCGETYPATVIVDYVHAYGKTITVVCTDNGSIQKHTSELITDNDGKAVITLTSLSDHDGVTALSIYVDDETCAFTTASITQPKLNTIEPSFAVNVSVTPCGVLDYAVWGSVTFNNAVGLGELVVKYDDSHVATITNQTATTADFRIEHMDMEGAIMQLTAYFENAATCSVLSAPFDSPDVPDLTLDNTAIDTVFTCGEKTYTVRVDFTPTNQTGDGYVLDSIAGGAVRTVETISATATAAQFDIARPATAEQHYVVVRYPATGCEVISLAIDVNTYTKPKPAFILKPIARLCNSETELILPDSITQGDIAEATLTLTDSKGKTVIADADMLINDSHDTLLYNLPSQLAAGKYTATVEARDTLGCETSATQSVEFAIDGVVFSKWTDVLLVDNEGGLFTGYQWYENDKLLEGKTDQVLYLPEGMSGKSYYCVLQTAEGAIYTCVSDFGDLPRSADNPKTQSVNHITVLPNRVATNGAVTVHQSLDENLHLILMSATGKRVAEYTQQEATKLIDMPGVQGIYLLRIESDSDVQTVKIVVY